MKRNLVSFFTLVIFVAVFALQPRVVAQSVSRSNSTRHPHYKLIDLGTFGGPNSGYDSAPVVQSLNRRGSVVGVADTSAADPDAPNCFADCFVNHAFVWQRGALVDLGVLPGGFNTAALSIGDDGLIMGFADNGLVDPISGLPELHGVVWIHGQIADLGTLGGTFSFGNAINNRGQVAGIAENATADPFSYLFGTQVHAFLWQDGVMSDLGTLGGPDSWGDHINERGQVSGWSYTNSTPNSSTGSPTQHPFLWENGTMTDLGTLGGTLAQTGSSSNGGGGSINARGQVIGTSNLAGDLTHHPFLWERGQLTDLGTLGGDNGEAYWINDAGEIVGRADVPGSQSHHAVLWKNGRIIDLGVLAGQPCSTAIDINSQGLAIINTGICGQGGGPGSLWENGVLYDLNDLIPANSALTIGDVNFINDQGEIAATGVLANGDEHAVLLIPCDENHPNMEGCDYSKLDVASETDARLARATEAVSDGELYPAELTARLRSMADHYRRFETLPRQ